MYPSIAHYAEHVGLTHSWALVSKILPREYFMADDFDFEQFFKLLYAASKSAFTSIQHVRKSESFYIFALYTCEDLGYVFPTSSTEEGLTQVAQKYSAIKDYQGFSIEQLREDLRWSPCDSPLHVEGEEYFVEVNKFLSDVPRIVHAIPEEESWSEFEDFVDKFLGVCINVLKQLDTEGIFGEGERRNSIVLNILMGDQSDEERLRFAKLLNPSSVYNHFEQVYHA